MKVKGYALLLLTIFSWNICYGYDYKKTESLPDYDAYLDSNNSPIVDNPNVGEIGAYYTLGGLGEAPGYDYATRYKNVSYMRKNGVHAHRNRGHRGRSYLTRPGIWKWEVSECGYWKNTYASEYSIDGIPNCLTDDHYISGDNRYDLPVRALSGIIGTSIDGHLISAFVGEDLFVYIGKNKKFNKIDVGLNEQSDVKDVLSIYPISHDEAVLAVYVYENSFNKSLYVYHLVDIGVEGISKTYRKLVHNNATDDKGMHPEIYFDGEFVNISSRAKNSEGYWKLKKKDIDNIDGYDNPSKGKDLISVNASYASAWVNTKLDVSGRHFPDDYKQPKYEFDSVVSQEYSFSGHILDSHLAITYAESKLDKSLTEDQKVISKRLSSYLNIAGDTETKGIRLGFSFYDLAGSYSYFEEGEEKSDIFKNSRDTYSFSWTYDQGKYSGFKYSNFKLPAELSLKIKEDDDQITSNAVIHDDHMETHILSWVWGIDENQYNSRYMMDYSGFFYEYEFGVGIEYSKFSEEAQNEAEAIYADKSPVLSPGINISAQGVMGYVNQVRFSSLKGVGGALQVGMRLLAENGGNGMYEGNIGKDEYATSYHRKIFTYGPFMKFSAVF